jgi:hypothetical protein
MRSLVRSVGIALGVLMFAGVQNASAQIIDTVEFTTTFPFTIGDTSVPAGSYTIRPDDDNPRVLELFGQKTSALFQVDAVDAPSTPSKTELVFSRYGDTYVLKNIWIEGSASGARTLPTEGERHVAKHPGAKGEQRVAARKKARVSSGQ